jgi:hypothetical protein
MAPTTTAVFDAGAAFADTGVVTRNRLFDAGAAFAEAGVAASQASNAVHVTAVPGGSNAVHVAATWLGARTALLEALVGVATRRCSLLTMAATDADTILKAYGQLGVENALLRSSLLPIAAGAWRRRRRRREGGGGGGGGVIQRTR